MSTEAIGIIIGAAFTVLGMAFGIGAVYQQVKSCNTTLGKLSDAFIKKSEQLEGTDSDLGNRVTSLETTRDSCERGLLRKENTK